MGIVRDWFDPIQEVRFVTINLKMEFQKTGRLVLLTAADFQLTIRILIRKRRGNLNSKLKIVFIENCNQLEMCWANCCTLNVRWAIMARLREKIAIWRHLDCIYTFLELFERTKLLWLRSQLTELNYSSPLAYLLVKFKALLKPWVFGQNFLSDLARGVQLLSLPWLRHWFISL